MKEMSQWIEHNGGPCPVPAGTMVDLKFRNRDILNGVKAILESVLWENNNHRNDIIAYRLHQPEQHDLQAKKSANPLTPYAITLQWQL